MSITEQRDSILTEMQDTAKKVEQFKLDLQSLIKALPDNPAIVTRLSDSCFIMKASDLTQTFQTKGRSVTMSVWDPDMHNFKVQYNRIAEYINKARIEDVCRTLNSIIRNGCIETRVPRLGFFPGYGKVTRFHPQVIENLKTIWR
jgi:hypothetical protein